jgi:ubiquinone/menaquinone biosynthesis C-methylase UbiE
VFGAFALTNRYYDVILSFMSNIISPIHSTARRLDQILSRHELPLDCFEGATVYDLGCGHSDIGGELAIRGVAAAVIGFDKNPDAINGSRHEASGTRRVLASLEHLPVPSESADIALASFSLPFWANSAKEITDFFAEATRIVRPNGVLSISPMRIKAGKGQVPFFSTSGKRFSALRSEVSKIRSGNWVPLTMDPFDPDTLTVRKI